MSKIAIISDLHSNQEALEAVLKDIESQKVDAIYCLGDIIGYGPNPVEIIRYCMTFQFTLLGNHEEGVLYTPIGFNKDAKSAIDWTRNQLNSNERSREERTKLWDFLDKLAEKHEENNGNILYVHATPRSHKYEYIRPPDVNDITKMMSIFSHIKHISFYGHTHEPGIFTSDIKFIRPDEITGKYTLNGNLKYFINIGSIGQPRDGDKRSCYVIFDGTSVEFRRVEYNLEKTISKIIETKIIPQRFAHRLREGK
ncbi:MAG: metallophosphoesterase family protein [Planctomycetes bacterium]|nr:metallophosphoesterase family protein [Planctomycetota bacterium]